MHRVAVGAQRFAPPPASPPKPVPSISGPSNGPPPRPRRSTPPRPRLAASWHEHDSMPGAEPVCVRAASSSVSNVSRSNAPAPAPATSPQRWLRARSPTGRGGASSPVPAPPTTTHHHHRHRHRARAQTPERRHIEAHASAATTSPSWWGSSGALNVASPRLSLSPSAVSAEGQHTTGNQSHELAFWKAAAAAAAAGGGGGGGGGGPLAVASSASARQSRLREREQRVHAIAAGRAEKALIAAVRQWAVTVRGWGTRQDE
jgi:hypothetical protein